MTGDASPREFRLSVSKANDNLWIALGAAGIAVVFGVFQGAPVIGILVGLGVAAFGFWQRRNITSNRAVQIAIGPDAIHAPAMAAKPVPWDAVKKVVLSSNSEHYKGGILSKRGKGGMEGFMALEFSGNPRDFDPPEGTYFGGPSLTMKIDELEGSIDDLRDAIAAARPALELVLR